MKTSVIRYRVADFLGEYPPFDSFSSEDRMELSGVGRVVFHEDDVYLYRQGQPRDPLLWVIQQGRVEILEETPAGEQLLDVLGAGDILGLGRYLGAAQHLHSARTATEVILYSIDADMFEALVRKYPAASRYLAAHFSLTNRYADKYAGVLPNSVGEQDLLAEGAGWLDTEDLPEGLIARRLSTDGLELSPVYPLNGSLPTVSSGLAPRDYLLQMLRARCHKLIITADGGPRSKPVGIVTESDLAILFGRNPILLVRQILAAETISELAYLRRRADAFLFDGLVGPSAVEWISEIAAELNAAITERVVRMAEDEMLQSWANPGLRSCLFFFGKAGRREILTPVIPDIGIVFADPQPGAESDARDYFTTLADKVKEKLEDCGLKARQSHSATNKIRTVRSMSEWKEFYGERIEDPILNAIYASREMFDIHILTGDRALVSELRDHILTELRRNEALIPVLANDTLANLPPLTVFQGIVIELDGTETPTLDIEKTALDPIEDAARVFAFAGHYISNANTVDRLENAAVALPHYASVLRDGASAFRIVSYYHAIMTHRRFGEPRPETKEEERTINPSRLSKYDQRLLKTTFDSIRRLLELTSTHFNLN